jgi:hypothetical protein
MSSYMVRLSGMSLISNDLGPKPALSTGPCTKLKVASLPCLKLQKLWFIFSKKTFCSLGSRFQSLHNVDNIERKESILIKVKERMKSDTLSPVRSSSNWFLASSVQHSTISIYLK